MRLLYTTLFYFALPLVLLRLYWRGIKAPDYRLGWLQRLGYYSCQHREQTIWIHAVSVGEAEAVFPLVKKLQRYYPNTHFLLTTTTPTGAARVRTVLQNTVTHVYLPYDVPIVIKRFLATFKPKVAIFMEKEIWPNLYAECKQQQIPVVIINARLSAKSAERYKKIASLTRSSLDCVVYIATQTDEDKERFIAIGAKPDSVHALGNLKFDLEQDKVLLEQALLLKKQLFADRFVWLVASTHLGEERVFLQLYSELKTQIPELLLVLVPRHPERFSTVAADARKKQLSVCRRSSAEPCQESTDVYLVDTIGELKRLYGTADICFVGGSLVPVGGHNILEPAALNVPIMFGQFMFNFKDIASDVLALKAAIQCQTSEEIKAKFVQLYHHPEARIAMTDKARQFLEANRGATDRTMAAIIKRLDESVN